MNKTLIAAMCLGVLNGDLYAMQRRPIPTKMECESPLCDASRILDGPAEKGVVADPPPPPPAEKPALAH
jgi:hypothetical protein